MPLILQESATQPLSVPAHGLLFAHKEGCRQGGEKTEFYPAFQLFIQKLGLDIQVISHNILASIPNMSTYLQIA